MQPALDRKHLTYMLFVSGLRLVAVVNVRNTIVISRRIICGNRGLLADRL